MNIVRRIAEEKRRRAGALQDASRPIRPLDQRASVLECGSPLPLSHPKEPITFTNEDIYTFAPELEKLHPDNRHTRDKMRQQLQVLRDTGFLEHIGSGEWRLK